MTRIPHPLDTPMQGRTWAIGASDLWAAPQPEPIAKGMSFWREVEQFGLPIMPDGFDTQTGLLSAVPACSATPAGAVVVVSSVLPFGQFNPSR